MRSLSADHDAHGRDAIRKDEDTARRLRAVKGFLVDMDGVIYRGAVPVPGAADALRALRARGPVLMLTNNSTKQAEPLAADLRRMGFDIPVGDIIIVTEIVERWLLDRHAGAALLVLAEDHVRARLAHAGFEIVRAADWRRASVVVVGCRLTMDHDLLGAALNALHGSAAFVATNPDLTVNGDDGLRLEAGAYVDMLSRLSGREPTVIGKPAKPCYDHALTRLGVPAVRTAMIGDNPDTDIRGARDHGLFGVLVLTGLAATASPWADLTVADIGAFARVLESLK